MNLISDCLAFLAPRKITPMILLWEIKKVHGTDDIMHREHLLRDINTHTTVPKFCFGWLQLYSPGINLMWKVIMLANKSWVC